MCSYYLCLCGPRFLAAASRFSCGRVDGRVGEIHPVLGAIPLQVFEGRGVVRGRPSGRCGRRGRPRASGRGFRTARRSGCGLRRRWGISSMASSSRSSAWSKSRWLRARFARERSRTAAVTVTTVGPGSTGRGVSSCRRRMSATTARSCSGASGLARKSMAPSFMASTASGTLPCAVTITTEHVVALGPDAAEHLQSVHLGHAQVEQDEVDGMRGQRVHRLGAVGRRVDDRARGFEHGAEDQPDVRLVIHDQNLMCLFS